MTNNANGYNKKRKTVEDCDIYLKQMVKRPSYKEIKLFPPWRACLIKRRRVFEKLKCFVITFSSCFCMTSTSKTSSSYFQVIADSKENI